MVLVRPRPLALPSATVLAALWLVQGCVSGVEIKEAPCPCPNGYQCCGSLNNACIKADHVCPPTHPASSRNSCEADAQCPQSELCRAWTRADGQLAGPRQCRRICSGEFPCADGEICQPTLHDGRALDAVNVTLACVAETPPAGCEEIGCQQCTPENIGRSYCVQGSVYGCFMALHPDCGLTCWSLQIQQCGPDACTESAQGASCLPVFAENWCDTYSCGKCGSEPAAGNLVCDGNDVVACASIPVQGDQCNGPCTCEQICQSTVVATCEGSCVVEQDTAHCAP